MLELVQERFEDAIKNLQQLRNSSYMEQLAGLGEEIAEAVCHGHTLYIAGNGGSASDAQHFAAELVGRFVTERRGLPAVALTTDTSVLTSVANDYEYDMIFARQIEALAKEGDLFIGISTSGNSKNVVEAVKTAKKYNVRTIAFVGKDGGVLKDMCDRTLLVPCDVTARVQEAQELSYHTICEIVDRIVEAKEGSNEK